MGSSDKSYLITSRQLKKIGHSVLEDVIGPRASLFIYVLEWLIGIAILIFVILIFAWMIPVHKDTNSILELTKVIDENTDDPGTDADCDDNNQCTKDECQFGRCDHYNLKNGAPCETPCFGGETSCQNGQCHGSCPDPNNCNNAGDCPDIAKAGGGNLDKRCDDQKCVWTITDVPPVLQGTCSHGNHGQNDLFSDKCRSCVANNEPLRNCLSIHAFCPVVAPNNNLDDLNCVFHFDCSHFAKLII